jgi:hypothetical protein
MGLITYFRKELERPDDQGLNWYAWATNQMSHALLGVGLAAVILTFSTDAAALAGVFGFAAVKEILDIIRGGRFKDSVQDLAFQLMGGFLAACLFTNTRTGILLAVAFLSLWIIAGVIPRARMALKRLKV